MGKRVLRPGRCGGSIRYSCSAHWASLAQADSVLRTCLRFTSPQSQFIEDLDVLDDLDVLEGLDLRDGIQYRLYGVITRGRGARVPSVVWSNGSDDPDDTRARYGILVQPTGLHSLRQTQCFCTCLSFTSPQSQFIEDLDVLDDLEDLDVLEGLDLRDGMGYRLYGVITRGRGAHVPSVVWSNGSDGSDDAGACRLHNRSMVKRAFRSDDTGACRLHNRSMVKRAFRSDDTRACRLHNRSMVKRAFRSDDTRACRLHNRSMVKRV